MKKLRLIFVALIFISNLAFGGSIGLSLSQMWTDNYELENPIGLSAHFTQSLMKKTRLRLEYSLSMNERNYFGVLVGGFLSPEDPQENVRSRSYVKSFEADLLYDVISTKRLSLGLGGGVHQTSLSANRKGLETGRETNLVGQNKYGVLAVAYIEIDRLLHLPLSFSIMAKYKSSNTSPVPLDTEAPFTSAIQLKLIQFGLSYTL